MKRTQEGRNSTTFCGEATAGAREKRGGGTAACGWASRGIESDGHHPRTSSQQCEWHPLLSARQSALGLSDLTPRTVPQPQQIFRVLMQSKTGTVLCGPRAVVRADVPGLPAYLDAVDSPRREPQERSEL